MPPCESSGLIDLCGVGAFIQQGWFTLQASNLVWYVVLVVLIVLAIAIPFPTRTIKDVNDATEGDGTADGDGATAA
jgi:phosphotransferase system  glucose/maltose/N-acetylglucosamine-specific IIC component